MLNIFVCLVVHKRRMALTWSFLQVWCASSLPNPKEQSFLFYKKVVPLNFELCSLENEDKFKSNQRAGKIMNVTRNKLFRYDAQSKQFIVS